MIKILKANSDQLSPTDLEDLYKIIIKGYELTEVEVWGENYVRIFPDEYYELVKSGNVLVALYNGKVAGGIYCYPIDSKTYGFSLLATDFDLKGKGIGTKLIQTAEDIAIKNGASVMSIEILRVRGLDVESKLTLAGFYERLGYRYTHSEDCSCKIHPEKYKRLAAPSDFDFYVKELFVPGL